MFAPGNRFIFSGVGVFHGSPRARSSWRSMSILSLGDERSKPNHDEISPEAEAWHRYRIVDESVRPSYDDPQIYSVLRRTRWFVGNMWGEDQLAGACKLCTSIEKGRYYIGPYTKWRDEFLVHKSEDALLKALTNQRHQMQTYNPFGSADVKSGSKCSSIVYWEHSSSRIGCCCFMPWG